MDTIYLTFLKTSLKVKREKQKQNKVQLRDIGSCIQEEHLTRKKF